MNVARRTGIKPSKLLIPVAYGSLLGGVATYFTTANIIVSDLLTQRQPAPGAAAHPGLYAHRRPDRPGRDRCSWACSASACCPTASRIPNRSIARRTGSELEDAYQLGERLWEAHVPAGSLADRPDDPESRHPAAAGHRCRGHLARARGAFRAGPRRSFAGQRHSAAGRPRGTCRPAEPRWA